MSTETIVSGFNKHFSKFRYISETPIGWDSEKEILIFKDIPGNKWVLVWHFNMIISVDTLGLGSVLYILYDQYFRLMHNQSTMNLTDFFVILFFGMWYLYGLSIHFVICAYGKDAANGWNEMKKFHKKLTDLGKSKYEYE